MPAPPRKRVLHESWQVSAVRGLVSSAGAPEHRKSTLMRFRREMEKPAHHG